MTRKCSSELLARLRSLMKDTRYVPEPLQAYIVPWADAHNSEYLAECDQRRAFLSGFTGSAGTAVVTEKDARLWTDGRYYLQASQELDSNWTLMKESLPATPSQATWLCKNLPVGSRVGADPLVVTHGAWKPLQEQLRAAGHALVAVERNLVDVMWTERPARPDRDVRELSESFCGRSVSAKLEEVRASMRETGAAALLLTALDEVAWLLNLRGSDIPYCPVFFAYALVTRRSVLLFTDKRQLREGRDVVSRLREACGGGLSVHAYAEVRARLAEMCAGEDGGKVWMSASAPHALASAVPESALLQQTSPVCLAKAVKNGTEAEGMRQAHLRDGAALCCFLQWLETEVGEGRPVTELSAAARLERFRAEQRHYVGPSFETISSAGPHAAVVHYKPTAESDAAVTAHDLYLVDSGAHYLDGTTDVTRTVHLGQPSRRHRECFTRVLQGQLALGDAVFPERVKGNCLDSLARLPLWKAGLDYQHGTGHGVGHYLNVHEGPMGISWRTYPEDPGLAPGMFLSNEPGYYEDGAFGIRLENIVEVVRADTADSPGRFLAFRTVTMCPIQRELVDVSLLSPAERHLLDAYHSEVRRQLQPLLQDRPHVLQWLERNTQPLPL